ncbi:MAG: class I SAM-dependent methyltransferase [Bacteriovorax sp.]|nr:class I SAM-dependent methyltransferase [Bacteriovorax sp.]
MNELIKIKMSDSEIDAWPSFLQAAITEKNKFNLELTPEKKLCDLCDYLYFSEGKLNYHSVDLGTMCFDFEETYRYHQRQHYALSREPLARALGIKGETHPYVWDTTCGTGKDSLLIRYFGAKLLSFERHPAIFLLLNDALRRYPLNFEIVFADASRLMPSENSDDDRPDVIYYDPMYPEKTGSKKSALPRKEMRIFKEVVGEDFDSNEFLDWALKTAKSRVVVKRALSATPIKENPTASYAGKSTRYDMYKIF